MKKSPAAFALGIGRAIHPFSHSRNRTPGYEDQDANSEHVNVEHVSTVERVLAYA